jgi:hypothetical protein
MKQYMKQYIIILVVVIILVIIIFNLNNKKEHYVISPTLEVDKINETVRQYYYNKENRQIENINVTKDLEIIDKTLYDELVEFKYPVGSFYVQYPDINANYDPQSELLFPIDKTPEKLFGGKWEDNWWEDGIFFRTGGTLSQENRNLGLQEWAVKHMYGWTSWAQPHYSEPSENLRGVFTTKDQKEGRTDGGGGGNDNGGSNTFDSNRMVLSSAGETRVKNRLIKVWRRIG